MKLDLAVSHCAKALFASIFFLACTTEPEGWVGDYVTYSSSPGLEICAGTHEHVDEFVAFMTTELGITTPRRLYYHWLDNDGFTDSPCENWVLGCASAGSAYSTFPALLHEVAHTVARSANMNHWPFFTEGIAVAFDPLQDELDHRYVIPPTPGGPLLDPRMFMTIESSEFLYGLAGSFVAFLLNRHGPEKFVAFTQKLGALSPERDLDELRGLFRQVYDFELDDESELFMVGAPCAADSFPVLMYDCTKPEIPWHDDGIWSYHKIMDCAANDVVGGVSPEDAWNSLHSVTVDIPSNGRYRVTITDKNADDFTGAQLGACFGCPWEMRGGWAAPGSPAAVDLDAGLYYLRIRSSSDRTPELKITITPEPDLGPP